MAFTGFQGGDLISVSRMTILEDEVVTLTTSAGPMQCLLLRPAKQGNYPGLVFYSEIFQITAPIRRVAAFLAGHGFLVLVPEIYHEFELPGTILEYTPEGSARGNFLKTEKKLDQYDSDARAALDFLINHPNCSGNLGVIGFCIGGHLAFRAAFQPDVCAAACFYPTDLHKNGLGQGAMDDSLARSHEITGELLMIWGRQDPHIPQEGRQKVYNRLTECNISFTWHEFNAQHAFMRDEGLRYDPELAHFAFNLVINFFRKLPHSPVPRKRLDTSEV